MSLPPQCSGMHVVPSPAVPLRQMRGGSAPLSGHAKKDQSFWFFKVFIFILQYTTIQNNFFWKKQFSMFIKDSMHMIPHLCPCIMMLFWMTQVVCGLQMYVGAWAISTWCRHTPSVWNLDHYHTINIQPSSSGASDDKAFILEDISSSELSEVVSEPWTALLFWLVSVFQYNGQCNHSSAWADLKSSKKL